MILVNDNYPINEYDESTEYDICDAIYKLIHPVRNKMHCATCGKQLGPDRPVNIYDHDGGWNLIDSIPKQWVSIECSCGYHNSINKLGVKR
jgi:hypothetical protein